VGPAELDSQPLVYTSTTGLQASWNQLCPAPLVWALFLIVMVFSLVAFLAAGDRGPHLSWHEAAGWSDAEAADARTPC